MGSPSIPNGTSGMDCLNEEITHAFQSKRLLYIKTDETNEHIKEFLPQVNNDPVVLTLASPGILRPQGKKDSQSLAENYAKSLLGVMICLLPSEEEKLGISPDPNKPTIIGTLCLGWGGITPEHAHHRNAAIGITLVAQHQNKGYGREAINWMLDWSFRHAGLHTVSIFTASFNTRGMYLYESLGFVLEGRRRETIWCNRKWYDELSYGMTEQEWEKLRGLAPA